MAGDRLRHNRRKPLQLRVQLLIVTKDTFFAERQPALRREVRGYPWARRDPFV